jgi:hypothetical protein
VFTIMPSKYSIRKTSCRKHFFVSVKSSLTSSVADLYRVMYSICGFVGRKHENTTKSTVCRTFDPRGAWRKHNATTLTSFSYFRPQWGVRQKHENTTMSQLCRILESSHGAPRSENTPWHNSANINYRHLANVTYI